MPTLDLTGISLNGVLTETIKIVPIVIPAMLGFVGLRKALSFLIGTIRKA